MNENRESKKKFLKDLKELNQKVAQKFLDYDNLNIDTVVDRNGCTYAERIYGQLTDCSKIISVYKNVNTGEFRLMRHRCKNRFCPICNHVESNNISLFLQQDYNNSIKDKTLYYTVVFTMANCKFDDFGNAMNSMSKAFSDWHKNYKKQLKYIAGLRTFEFTYNKRHNTMHPHIHCLFKFQVDNIKAKRLLINKLNHFNWGSSFARYLPLKYVGLCYMGERQMIADSQNLSDFWKVNEISYSDCLPFTIYNAEPYNPNKTTLFEFSKYITKFTKLLCLSPQKFVSVYRMLSNFKTRAFLGEWRTWKKQIQREDGETWIDSDSVNNDVWQYYTSFNLINDNLNNIVDDTLKDWLHQHFILKYLE